MIGTSRCSCRNARAGSWGSPCTSRSFDRFLDAAWSRNLARCWSCTRISSCSLTCSCSTCRRSSLVPRTSRCRSCAHLPSRWRHRWRPLPGRSLRRGHRQRFSVLTVWQPQPDAVQGGTHIARTGTSRPSTPPGRSVHRAEICQAKYLAPSTATMHMLQLQQRAHPCHGSGEGDEQQQQQRAHPPVGSPGVAHAREAVGARASEAL